MQGDQASIVGGAIEFVKELEHLLQSLEAQKLQLLEPEQPGACAGGVTLTAPAGEEISTMTSTSKLVMPPPFAQFFVYPQYTWSQIPNKYTSKSKAAIADIEVTLIETHANLRILSRRSPRQLSKLVVGFQTLHLSPYFTSMSPPWTPWFSTPSDIFSESKWFTFGATNSTGRERGRGPIPSREPLELV